MFSSSLSLVDIKFTYDDDDKTHSQLEEEDWDTKIGDDTLPFFQAWILTSFEGYGSDKDKAAADCIKDIVDDENVFGYNCFEKK